jgi:hypothetical protein
VKENTFLSLLARHSTIPFIENDIYRRGTG